jgi:hypothetical protein
MIIMSRRFIRFGAVMEAKIRRKHNLSNNDYTRKLNILARRRIRGLCLIKNGK